MAYHYLWLSANPEYAPHLRRANEERSAAFYQGFASLWRRLSLIKVPAAAIAGWLQRRVRERAALRELSALDDHSLKDIGIARGEIRRIARAFSEGEEVRRRSTGDVEVAINPQTPAWLRGVVDGGHAGIPAQAKPQPTTTVTSQDDEPAAAHG